MEEMKDMVKEVIVAVLPMVGVVVLLQFTIIWMPFEMFVQFLIGAFMVSVGLILFLLGVHIGLLPIGEMIGSNLPKSAKFSVVIFVGFLLGFVVTVAEPDVRVLSSQVDQVSQGVISNQVLVLSVALGVAVFVAIAMIRSIFHFSLRWILVGSYMLVFTLAAFTPRHFVPISFDAGGVTTGPLTVPFILALGVGLASVLKGSKQSADGFGIVALASIGPILAVMVLGVIYQ
ncbi:DUF1538 domain-containing protein [Texcoconibacillus texcoconensis]|uniref:Protein-S-isoprenylcysteine O-methyltransferase Ste14 n=1 Tax=Texcoconibacillus texcoconensis TaxID=1095777 RepID=A0A840QRR3_9BACI|nr:DUF1538 domain-containing protein [Texcoconibacillus texcoconensis]MBB5174013.1 protein-S-isoprenylcysteine O-methyltransferase Ste14 [Texcoconibacillus texcoconensis]